MRIVLSAGLLAACVVGCSGEPAPPVGDAPITKGIQPKASPYAGKASAMRPNTLTPAEYKKLREKGNHQ